MSELLFQRFFFKKSYEIDESRTCFFTGHRIIPQEEIDDVINKTKQYIIDLINKGVNTFLCGGALGFDTICGQIVLSLKNEYKNIKLYMIIPCKDQDKYWNNKDKETYWHLIKNADRVIYTQDKYKAGCMHLRNRFMSDNSSYAIAYLKKSGGGTAYTVKYAQKNGVNVLLI